jgi:hypothetical protein
VPAVLTVVPPVEKTRQPASGFDRGVARTYLFVPSGAPGEADTGLMTNELERAIWDELASLLKP